LASYPCISSVTVAIARTSEAQNGHFSDHSGDSMGMIIGDSTLKSASSCLKLDLPSGKRSLNYGKYHFSWVNPLFLWPFSIAMFVYQRVWDKNG
jgi:hypothetical protein